MTEFRKKQEAAESNNEKVLGKIANNKTPRIVQSQSGNITNNFGEGDIYMSDDALKYENECLKKSLQEKDETIAALKGEIELLKEILGK